MSTARAETAGKDRLHGIDVLRGLVMVLMALDHARDFVGDFSVDPTDLANTTPALFLTRWVTHFCAPVFVFLAGTSAWLAARRRSPKELSRFLWKRGAWLIVLEFTLVQFTWMHTLSSVVWFSQVIAAIGVAMLVLGGLVRLSLRTITVVGLVIVARHDLLDPIEAADLGPAWWLWVFLHEGGVMPLPNGSFFLVVYPLLPWIGVMALGYAFGSWTTLEREVRRDRVRTLGLALCVGFVVLRVTNLYGDPNPWTVGDSPLWTALSFVNCQKYPPSLLYLAMTLGPAFLLLAAVDRAPSRVGRLLETFGRVPLFYYVAHIMLLHSAGRLYYLVREGEAFRAIQDGLSLLFTGQPLPEWYGAPLWIVYAFWVGSVLLLYPACAWYAERKATRPLAVLELPLSEAPAILGGPTTTTLPRFGRIGGFAEPLRGPHNQQVP